MGKTIVIVDDEEDLCQILKLAIQSRRPDLDVRMAHDGESGFALIRQTKPQVAILDIKMPKANGYEVLNRLRADATLNKTRIIILTSLTEGSSKSDADWAKSLEIDAFITKPYEMEDLLERLWPLVDENQVK